MIVTYKYNKLPHFFNLKINSPVKYIVKNFKSLLTLKNISKKLKYKINTKKVVLH